jgi:hypothetical protein
VLADVIKTPRSALPAVHLEAQEDSLVSVLLSLGAFVFEGHGEPLELSLEAAFTSPPMTSRAMARLEDSLAPAAHEDSGVLSIAPLMLTGLLGRVPPPLPASGG